jgi:hypothetical protein
MRTYLLAVVGLALSAGGALAQSPVTNTTTAPAGQPVASANGYYGYYSSGYVFPNEGSPSGDDAMARPVPQPQGPGLLTRVYLFPPSAGNDDSDAGG